MVQFAIFRTCHLKRLDNHLLRLMKKSTSFVSRLLAIVAISVFASVATAETKVKLSDVHLCCGACQKGVERAVSKVSGSSVQVDRKAGSVVVSAGDAATVKKALNAIGRAGYYGKSNNSKLQIAEGKVGNGRLNNASVSGAHLCCGKCVKAIDEVVASVNGATGHDAKKGSKTFTIKGSYSAKELAAAFHKQGLSAQIK